MPKRTTKWYRKNEADVMKRIGFVPTKNSGAGWIEKEDGQNDYCICQLKSTDAQSISVKQNDLHVLENNASISHKIPVFAVQFINTDEVWLMIKPEHIQAIKGIAEGIQYNPITYDTGICIDDIDSEQKYVKTKQIVNNVSDRLSSRIAYLETKQKEYERRNKSCRRSFSKKD